jgi:hypothetical protein
MNGSKIFTDRVIIKRRENPIQTLISTKGVSRKAYELYVSIEGVSQRVEIVEGLKKGMKKEEDVEDLAGMICSRKKWSAARLLRISERSGARQVFLLYLAHNYPSTNPQEAGEGWLEACVKIGRKKRKNSFQGVTGMAMEELAVAKLQEMGLDV